MASSKQLAAWLLVGLATAGVLLPLLVILVLQPKSTEKVYEMVSAMAPLDIYIVLDASGSVSDVDWRESLLFARDLAVQLNTSVPQFRAGLGQFSSDFQGIFPVREDVSALAALPAGVKAERGGTEWAKAVCGNSFNGYTKEEEVPERCVGGAFGMLREAPPQPLENLPPNCEELSSKQMIILVTDGRPGRNDKSASMLASSFLKSSTNVTLVGILVKHDAKGVEGQILYGLSSCCPAKSMTLTDTEDVHVVCKLPVNESCPYMASMKDYAALRRSIDGIVQALGDELQCEGRRALVTYLPDSRSLWFLVLLLPILLHQVWQRCLLHLGGSYKSKEARDAPPADLEMTTDVPSRVPEEPPAPKPEPTTAADEARASQAGLPEARFSNAEAPEAESRASTKGKKWAPVRTAYIINGARMDVDYGRSSAVLPPTAPNAARRGNSIASLSDLPETAREMLRSTAEAENEAASVVGVMSVVHPEDLPPEVRKFNCSIFAPLLLTLLLLPFVIVKSGILAVLHLETETAGGRGVMPVITW